MQCRWSKLRRVRDGACSSRLPKYLGTFSQVSRLAAAGKTIVTRRTVSKTKQRNRPTSEDWN